MGMNSNFCDVKLILHPRYTRYVDLLISKLSQKNVRSADDSCCWIIARRKRKTWSSLPCYLLELFRQLMIMGETFFCYYLVFVCTENCKKSSTEKLHNGIFPLLDFPIFWRALKL